MRAAIGLWVASMLALGCAPSPVTQAEDETLEQADQELTPYHVTALTVPGLTAGFTVDQISAHSFVMHAYSNAVLHDLGNGSDLLLVDSMSPSFLGGNDLANIQTTISWLKAQGKISSTHVKYLANTHWHPDHVGNNAALRQADTEVISARGGSLRLSTPQSIHYFGADLPAWPSAMWPDSEVANVTKRVNKRIVLSYAPYSHTTTDLVVTLPQERVVIIGDLALQGWLAFTDNDNGGTMRGLVVTLQGILNATPASYQVVPGHNAVMTKAQAQAWLDTIRQGIAYVGTRVAQGKSLTQIQTAAALPVNQGGIAASVKALDSGLLPLAAFVGFVYADLTQRDDKALFAARLIANLDIVSKTSMVSAIKLATAGPQNAAGTEYDTLAFEVRELKAIDAQARGPAILNPGAVAAFNVYEQFVQAARSAGRTDLTTQEYAQLLGALAAL
jgi:glyoxylase-like metal-dependent hydrolase (beta-lactamase superfamily II)